MSMFGRSAPPSGSVNPERIEAAMVEYVDCSKCSMHDTMLLTDVRALQVGHGHGYLQPHRLVRITQLILLPPFCCFTRTQFLD